MKRGTDFYPVRTSTFTTKSSKLPKTSHLQLLSWAPGWPKFPIATVQHHAGFRRKGASCFEGLRSLVHPLPTRSEFPEALLNMKLVSIAIYQYMGCATKTDARTPEPYPQVQRQYLGFWCMLAGYTLASYRHNTPQSCQQEINDFAGCWVLLIVVRTPILYS